MNTSELGSLGEIKALAYFIENGYVVFTQFDGKAPFDLVVYKNNKLERVSVKSTATRRYAGWVVSLREIRSNHTSHRIKKFDKKSCDILAVYIKPRDKILLLDPKKIKNKSSISIRDSDI